MKPETPAVAYERDASRPGANRHGIGPDTDGGPNPDYSAAADLATGLNATNKVRQQLLRVGSSAIERRAAATIEQLQRERDAAREFGSAMLELRREDWATIERQRKVIAAADAMRDEISDIAPTDGATAYDAARIELQEGGA